MIVVAASFFMASSASLSILLALFIMRLVNILAFLGTSPASFLILSSDVPALFLSYYSADFSNGCLETPVYRSDSNVRGLIWIG